MANLANGEFQTSKSSKLNRVAGAYRLNRVQACFFVCGLKAKKRKKTDGCKSNFSRLRDSGKENSVKPTRQKNIITAQSAQFNPYLFRPKKETTLLV